MPMEAVGVSKRADSGASLPISPEMYAMVPLVRRATRPSSPLAGENRNVSMTRLLSGPSERVELSRRMTPSDPSEPVLRMSPTTSFVPAGAGKTFPSRVTVTEPLELCNTPMVSWATAGSAPARRNTVTSRITMDSLVLMVFLPEYVNVPVLLFLLLPVQWHGRYVPNGGEEETC